MELTYLCILAALVAIVVAAPALHYNIHNNEHKHSKPRLLP